jgi:DNA polymerase-3 subunit delta'
LFENIRGQERTLAILKQAVVSDRAAHSYLFHGPAGVGKFTTALYFGMALNCTAQPEARPCGVCNSCRKFLNLSHPDLFYHFPSPNLEFTPDGESKARTDREKLLREYSAFIENRRSTPWREFRFGGNSEIRIDIIRWLEHRIHISAHEGRYKIAIIEDADLINQSAANAFLKTLEEPPTDTVIILTTCRPDALMPTILSRCQRVAFRLLPRRIVEEELSKLGSLEPLAVKTYARIAGGNLEKAMRLAETGNLETREDAVKFLEIVIAQDDIAFIAFMQKRFATKAQAALLDFLAYLFVLIADIGLYKNLTGEIANIDRTKLFDYCYQRRMNLDEEIVDILGLLETIRTRVETNNVSPQLSMIRIYHLLGERFGFRN